MNRLLVSSNLAPRASSSRALVHLERPAGVFLQQSTCKRGYGTSSTSSSYPLYLWRNSRPQNTRYRPYSFPTCTHLFTARRAKSSRAQTKTASASDVVAAMRQLGDEPPLFDGKPAFWARWVYLLLALDVLFIGFSVDMVMRNWTQLVEVPQTSDSPQDQPSSSQSTKKYELRPLWQRLALSTFEIGVGVAAGALILASRDRTVWRLRVQLASINPHPRPPGLARTKSLPSTSAANHTVNVLVLETGSGRTKRFLMRGCSLGPGRDPSEMLLEIDGVRGRFVLSLNAARVLGETVDHAYESKTLKKLAKSKDLDEDVADINPKYNTAYPENPHLDEFRRALARAWILTGGKLMPIKPYSPSDSGWTSGPVASGIR